MEQITFENLPKAFSDLFLKVESIEKLLQAKAESQPQADELLTIQQAAAFLKLSVPTLYGLVSRSELPVNKRGKRLYFSKIELTAWVKAGRKKTIAELQSYSQISTSQRKRK
jgi:excisionase family DNA binding protein